MRRNLQELTRVNREDNMMAFKDHRVRRLHKVQPYKIHREISGGEGYFQAH